MTLSTISDVQELVALLTIKKLPIRGSYKFLIKKRVSRESFPYIREIKTLGDSHHAIINTDFVRDVQNFGYEYAYVKNLLWAQHERQSMTDDDVMQVIFMKKKIPTYSADLNMFDDIAKEVGVGPTIKLMFLWNSPAGSDDKVMYDILGADLTAKEKAESLSLAALDKDCSSNKEDVLSIIISLRIIK